jgi:hypothetical protein
MLSTPDPDRLRPDMTREQELAARRRVLARICRPDDGSVVVAAVQHKTPVSPEQRTPRRIGGQPAAGRAACSR